MHKRLTMVAALALCVGAWMNAGSRAAASGSLGRPTLSVSSSGNSYVRISWQAVSGAVSYDIQRTQLNYQGTLANGVTHLGPVTSKKDFPYQEPDFQSFREANGTIDDAACGFATYSVRAVGSTGQTGPWSLTRWIAVEPCSPW